jgi:hypothetical protein
MFLLFFNLLLLLLLLLLFKHKYLFFPISIRAKEYISISVQYIPLGMFETLIFFFFSFTSTVFRDVANTAAAVATTVTAAATWHESKNKKEKLFSLLLCCVVPFLITPLQRFFLVEARHLGLVFVCLCGVFLYRFSVYLLLYFSPSAMLGSTSIHRLQDEM